MAVADLVQEAFDDEAIRGPLSTRGIMYTAMGPWAAGSASVFLNDSAGNDGGAPGEATFAKGGTGALAAALAKAAESLGVTIRTGAEVTRIRTEGGRVFGVTLADGSEIDAKAVVTAADPKRSLNLCDPVELGPHMVWRANNIRTPGATAKVNLALSGLPTFHGADDPERLKGRIVIGTSIDYVEKAKDAVKYGHLAEEPWLEATIPTLVDPSLAPEGKHVMSVLVEGAPRHLRDSTWDAERDRLGDVTVKTLRAVRSGLRRARRGPRGHHDRRPRDRVRPLGRARLPRRAGAGSVLRLAAAGGGGALQARLRGSVPGRLRRPPGWRRHGRSRGERRPRDPGRPRLEVGRVGTVTPGRGRRRPRRHRGRNRAPRRCRRPRRTSRSA